MPRLRRVMPLCVALLSASLAGCMQNDFLGKAPNALDPAVTASTQTVIGIPDGQSDLAKAKQLFGEGDYGLAEELFRHAVESAPGDSEAWLGLAATHDQLGRYDLADREYGQVEKKSGKSVGLLNNRGYSYMLRGDYARARRDLIAAARLDPNNEYVSNNLRRLKEKTGGRG